MADRESSVAYILQNLRGAIMFGVPSLGMEQSHLMAMVEGQLNGNGSRTPPPALCSPRNAYEHTCLSVYAQS